jgi:hypothetical protein
MDSTTNITELPQIQEESLSQSVKNSQLHESQIQQLVTGIQDASFKGATRLRSTDIPVDPSTLLIDPEIIPKQLDIPEPTVDPVIHTPLTFVDHLRNFIYDSRIPILVGSLAGLSQLPMVTDYIKRSFPWMYSETGHITLIGLLVYIITIGAIYYILTVTLLAK